MKPMLKILILEDDVNDVELISKILERSGTLFNLTVVTEKSEFEAAINTYTYDVILADNSLPQFDAVTALTSLQQKKIGTPFILVTGTVSEEFAVDVIHKGADDYILKGNLKKLPSAIDSAITKWKMKKEKNMAEKALRESEQRYRILFESASDGIVLADPKGKLTDANTRACAMTGYTLEEMRKLSITDVFPEHDLATMPIQFEQLLNGKTVLSERRIRRKDGSFIYVELSAKVLPDGRFQAIARDVTDRKKLEAQLIAEKINHQKKLAQATVDGQEKERTEIGKELHDNVNQILSATKLFLTTAEADADISMDMIARSISNVSLAIEEIRKLSKSLVTPAVTELGFIDSLHELVQSIRLTTELTINLQVNESDLATLNYRQQITLYRIVQEQMNNIIKHADAGNIDILVRSNDHFIYMDIIDDGKGFDVNEKRAGIGLSNIQSRAELLNGTVSIHSQPGRGCSLHVMLPLDAGAAETGSVLFTSTVD